MKKALRRKGIVSLLVLFSLSISLRAGEAIAVTQSEIDDIQRQRESLTAQREQSQAKGDKIMERNGKNGYRRIKKEMHQGRGKNGLMPYCPDCGCGLFGLLFLAYMTNADMKRIEKLYDALIKYHDSKTVEEKIG